MIGPENWCSGRVNFGCAVACQYRNAVASVTVSPIRITRPDATGVAVLTRLTVFLTLRQRHARLVEYRQMVNEDLTWFTLRLNAETPPFCA